MFRNVMIYNTLPTLREHLICIAFCAGALLIGTTFFNKRKQGFIMRI